jgi:hypothetical protein
MVGMEPTIRLLAPSDSLEELTLLLNRAYQRLAAMGFNYTAVDQTVETTRERIEDNDCYVAVIDGRIVGTALLIPHQLDTPAWANQPGVAYAGQLGVEPEASARGSWTRSRAVRANLVSTRLRVTPVKAPITCSSSTAAAGMKSSGTTNGATRPIAAWCWQNGFRLEVRHPIVIFPPNYAELHDDEG